MELAPILSVWAGEGTGTGAGAAPKVIERVKPCKYPSANRERGTVYKTEDVTIYLHV